MAEKPNASEGLVQAPSTGVSTGGAGAIGAAMGGVDGGPQQPRPPGVVGDIVDAGRDAEASLKAAEDWAADHFPL